MRWASASPWAGSPLRQDSGRTGEGGQYKNLSARAEPVEKDDMSGTRVNHSHRHHEPGYQVSLVGSVIRVTKKAN